MDKSNGYNSRKYEKQCDKQSMTCSKVEWSGMDLGSLQWDKEDISSYCV